MTGLRYEQKVINGVTWDIAVPQGGTKEDLEKVEAYLKSVGFYPLRQMSPEEILQKFGVKHAG